MTTDYRAKLQMIDLRSGYNCICSLPGKGISDSVGLAESNNDSAVITQSILGAHAGTNWTTWATPTSGAAVAQLYYGYYTSTVGQFNICGYPCAATAGPAFNRTGAVLEGWEYRRYTTGTTPFWTPLRFPGQYHDEVTALNQNWNRFYEPMTGRYLEAEPMYARYPHDVTGAAMQGHAVPYYAYAGNNPISQTDPSPWECKGYDQAVSISLKRAGCGDSSSACPVSDPGSCRNMIKGISGCDICPILRDGQGPLLSWVDLPFIQQVGSRNAAGSTVTIDVGGERSFTHTRVLKEWCDDPDGLASILIHEAMHVCSGSQHIGDPEAGSYNKEFCHSPFPNEH